MSLHPIRTTEYLRDTYERYLKTIYPFQDNALRTGFWDRLAEPDRLVKGPLLEASPPFKPGSSIAELVHAGVLHPHFEHLCGSTAGIDSPPLPYHRPLYMHQEKAIRNIVQQGRNLVVATGTGSGKTEAFLISILNYLFEEEEQGTLAVPGVRALLLYPMNALANDQQMRLRVLLQGYPSITFGRYTGETLETKKQAEERFLHSPNPGPLLINEPHSREEMRERPPHFLLTNYAMLEYLLLRPQDTELFDGPTGGKWRFIVVDEAHVYDGANGIEIAMLLRRLKDRVVSSKAGRLTCIATSATIGRGSEDFPQVAGFARNLFGEPFSAEDVFAAEHQPTTALGHSWGRGTPALYAELAQLTQVDAPTVARVATKHTVPSQITDAVRKSSAEQVSLYELLRGDERLQSLQRYLRQKPAMLSTAARRVFPELTAPEADEAIINLVDLAVRARPDGDSLPLLPARYHLFARALEGAFACLNVVAHKDGRPHVYLNRHERCPLPECQAQVFELATCARCGVAYIVGEKVFEGATHNGQRQYVVRPLKGDMATGHGSQRVYYVIADALPNPNEDETITESTEEEADAWLKHTLCLQCGAITDAGQQPCGCGQAMLTVRLAPFDGNDEDQMYCPVCSTRSRGTVYRLLTGRDAPVSVLTTGLYTELPPSTDANMLELPGQGRKLLMFADSRQDAAFFAPYMERTFDNLLQRRLIYQALTSDEDITSGMLRLNSVSRYLLRQAEQAGIFTHRQDHYERRILMQSWLMRELMSWGHNQSLEGQGLLHLSLVQPTHWKPPAALLQAPWNLTPGEAWELIAMLLDTVRRALTFPDGVDPRDELFAPLNRPYFISDLSLTDPSLRKRHAVLGWLPRSRSNGRLDLIDRFLTRAHPHMHPSERERHAQDALSGIWRHLTEPGSPWGEYLKVQHLGAAGPAYQLDHAMWNWQPSTSDTGLWRCDRCRSIAYHSLQGVCSTYGCKGELQLVHFADLPGKNNHYRYLYNNLKPAALNIQEHTAQWRPEKAREIQEEFIDGRVNILSCSTTFELGVDVGTLQAVFMRNMPPTTANYLQRAGRAGRRTDTVAFVFTYAQRRSHDLAYYRQPENMVSGAIPTPTIAIRNPKIVQRHAHSVLIAAFLRWCADTYDRFRKHSELQVGSFFAPPGDLVSGTDLLAEYLATPPEHVRQALLRIVPVELHEELRVADWGWLEQLTNSDGVGAMDLAAAQVLEDVNMYIELAREAAQEANERGAWQAASYYRVLKTIRERYLLNFFGQRNVLPKYGFPVDVVPLHTDHIPDEVATQVELDRDLRIAISEFAPGSQLVAAKRLFTGGGLYKQPHKDWVSHQFAICGACGRFNRGRGNDTLNLCVSCGSALQPNIPGRGGVMVRPEFGFVARRDARLPAPGESRPPRTYASQVYFDDYYIPDHLVGAAGVDHVQELSSVVSLSGPDAQIDLRYSRYGQLVVINHGPGARGFQVCLTCGHAESAPDITPGNRRRSRTRERAHKNPRTGRDCSGFTKVYRLGHEFLTDVLELQVGGGLPATIALPEGKELWRSLLYALLEGASAALGIRRTDLNGTLYPYRASHYPALILYDDVPGGAGHVRRIADSLPAVLNSARDRLSKCECGRETACHECLWNYYNQPFHDVLSRGAALDLIDGILAQAETLAA